MRAYELHASPKQVQRSKGRSSVAAAAYRSASKLVDERTGEIHDYTRKSGVEFTRIYIPENAPAWATNREELWNNVETIEKKSNSMTAREWEIAFPAEFNVMQRREAGDAISREIMSRYNCAVDIAYHAPSKDGDERNYHAHILYTTRGFDETTVTGWSKNKYRNFSHDLVKDKNGKTLLDSEGKKIIKSSQEALEMRQFFADEMNRIATRDNLQVKTEHLSFEERGINKQPSKHLGSTASEMERNGDNSRIGDENREIKAANDNVKKLQDQKKIIDLEFEREKRKLEEKQRLLSTSKVNQAFVNSNNAPEFINALKEEGYHLARGRTGGFVLVDEVGEIHSLVKNIEGKTYRQIEFKLAGIESKELENAETLSKEIKVQDRQQPQFYDRDAEEVKQQNALADAAEKAAQEQIKAEAATIKRKANELAQKQAHYKKQTAAFAKREKSRLIQRFINEKTQESREKWSIDELVKQREELRKDLIRNSGFIARMAGKKRDAQESLEAQQKTLNERLWRFKDDIIYFNRNRPQWLLDKELEKYGLKTEHNQPIKNNRTRIHERIKQYKAKTAIEQSQVTPEKQDNQLSNTLDGSFGRYVEQSAHGEIEQAQTPNLSQSFMDKVDNMANGIEEDETNELNRHREL